MSLPVRLLLIIGLLALGFAAGWRVCDWRNDAAQLQEEREDRALAKARQVFTDRLALLLEHQRSVKADKDRTIIKEVVRYESLTPADRRCALDGNWRMLHDAAATGTPADPAGLAARTAPPITDAAALETVAGNYEACRDYIDQLNGWNDWWGGVKR